MIFQFAVYVIEYFIDPRGFHALPDLWHDNIGIDEVLDDINSKLKEHESR